MKNDKIIFDLDGVLLDSETNLDWLNRALSRALEELGMPVTGENIEKLYPGGLREFETAVRDFPAPPEKVWKVRDKHYIEEKLKLIYEGDLKPFSDVDSLERLTDEYSLGVISNSPDEVVDRFIRYYRLDDLFEAWVGRGSELNSIKDIKPDPHLFGRLKEKMGDGRFWYVGDREVDREFAVNTGMEFLHLTRNGEGFESLEELVDRLV
ncbi:MAG: HAD family hydrolase [Candidatus Bipolaricaulia bacterium]